MSGAVVRPSGWERVMTAVEKVRLRLRCAVGALDTAGVPYAVIEENAVAAWGGEVDEAAVRFTQDVDLMIERLDLDRARQALESAGFVYRHASGSDMFLDGPGAQARDAVHSLFAGEKVRPEYVCAAPTVARSQAKADFRVLDLDALVAMKLTSYRTKDRTQLLDMIDVGLLDAAWVARVPPELRARLQDLLDHPER